MCYAVSTSADPLGSYYRYQFVRPLFPDYPRPAVWPDGYYVPTSTGDRVVQKQAFVVDRAKMLKGEDATEQGFIIDGVNFLNNADVDGQQSATAGRAEHPDGRRRHAVETYPGRRRHLLSGSSTSIGTIRPTPNWMARRKSPSRRITTLAAVS